MSNIRLFAATFAGLGQLIIGLYLAWCSPYLPDLMSSSSHIKVTFDEATWISSIWKLGAVVGSVISILVLDVIGRKTIILFCVIPNIISWSMTAWSTTVIDLIIARFIGGISNGVMIMAGPMYLAESSPPYIRGTLCTCFLIMALFGALIGYIMGLSLSIQYYSYIALLISSIHFLAFVGFPETPYYLIRQKRYVQAMDSLSFLRGGINVTEEMNATMGAVELEPKNIGLWNTMKLLLSSPGGLKTFLIGLGLMLVQGASGAVAILSYAQMIFDSIDNIVIQGMYLCIILMIVDIVAHIACIMLVDTVGRKPLVITSCVGAIIFSFFTGLYFYFQKTGYSVEFFSWIPIMGILLYVMSVNLGTANVTITILSEIFPMYSKVACVNLCQILNFVWAFGIMKLWGITTDNIDVCAAFWMLTSFNLLSLPFIVFCVPETKHKTLQQIQAQFINKYLH